MYLTGSFCAQTATGSVKNQAQKTTWNLQELEESRIQCAAESVCLYRLGRAEVNGPRCLFRAAPRKAKLLLFTANSPASSMQRIQHAISRRASLGRNARRLSRETGRRDLRRPSGHPASPRVPA